MASWFDGALSGLSGLFGGAAKGVGNLASKGMSGISNIGSQLLSGFGGGGGLNSIFKGSSPISSGIGSGMNNYSTMASSTPGALMALNQNRGFSGILGNGLSGVANAFAPAAKRTVNSLASGATKGGMGGNIWNALKGFGGSQYAGPAIGLATLFGSQLIQNPKAPALPAEFQQYMQQQMNGGNPYQQAIGKYNMGVLSGEDQGAYNAAVEGVDQAYQQELENLRAAYRSARPGSDITTDAAFKRDEAELAQRYAQRKALVMDQVQGQASDRLSNLGQQQSQGMQSGIDAIINNQNTQLGMDYDKTSGFRNAIAGIGSNMFTGPMQMKIFKQMFGG